MALVIGFLFAMPNQTREIYRAIAQMFAAVKPTQPKTLQIIMFEVSMGVVGVVVVAVVLWLTARRAASHYQVSTGESESQPGSADLSQRPWVLTWVPRILAATPPAFAAGGLYLASVNADVIARLQPALEPVFTRTYIRITNDATISKLLAKGNIVELLKFNSYLIDAALILLAIAFAVFVLVSIVDRPRLSTLLYNPRGRPGIILPILTVIALLAIISTIMISPVELPQKLGAIFIMSIFLVMLQLILMQLQTWRQHLGIPFTLVLILAAILFSLNDWNDNHAIRSIEQTTSKTPKDVGFKEALKRWIESRQDLKRYAGSRYPVYVVAAQGGGIYAAKHVASFLGELQDLCPGFGHHLFAISGVSGGSVGAAVFAALTKQYNWSRIPDDTKYRCVAKLEGRRAEHFAFATTEVFRRDLWSPLSASLLFPDFLQRFIPFPVPVWDRARALEYALESSYDRAIRVAQFPVTDANIRPLSRSFLEHWNPEQHAYTPALVLNTTEVGTGRRRIIAPFSFGPAGLSFIPVWPSAGQGADGVHRPNPPLSSAAGLSARFPWITPSAHFYESYKDSTGNVRKKKVRVVDGGYFENSGVVTALDLIKDIVGAVRRGELNQKIEINLLIFTSANFDAGESSGLGEAVDPMRAVFNARTARGGIAIEEAITTLRLLSSEDGPVKADIVKLELNGYGYPLPLGWRLSPITRHLISLHNGTEAECRTAGSPPSGKSEFVTASCAKRRIYDRLH